VAGLAAALAVVGRVEADDDETAAGELLGVHARTLLLDAAVRRADDEGRVRGGFVEAGGPVQVGGDLDAVPVAVAHGRTRHVVGQDEGVTIRLQGHEERFLPAELMAFGSH
jgi:hypothetical protein